MKKYLQIIFFCLINHFCYGMSLAATTEIINIIVPASPGSAPDLVARKLATIISSQLNVGAIIENIPGANGEIAANKFLKSSLPNTLFLAQDTVIVVNPTIYQHEELKIWEQSKPIARIAKNEFFLLINSNNPANNLVDFFQQNSSKELKYGSGGIGSLSDLFFRRLSQINQVNAYHIPYKGNGEAALGLSKGEVDIIASGTGAFPLVQSGKIKIISVLSDNQGQRFPNTQNIKYIYPQLTTSPWFGLFANKQMSNEMVNKLTSTLQRSLETPVEKNDFLSSGFSVEFLAGSAFISFLENQYNIYSNLLKSIHLN